MVKNLSSFKLVIHGRVQGVFFRDSMRMEAEKLGITGWVRNCHDGTVEAVVQGDAESVELIMRWAQRGPRLAQVEKVDVMPDDGTYSSFNIYE